jgi:hypothetical protein
MTTTPPLDPTNRPFVERRVNLSGELQELRDSVSALAEAIASFDEDRLRDAIIEDQEHQRKVLLAEQRRERNRLLSFVVLGVVLLAAIGIGNAYQSRQNHGVADQIRQCQTPGTPCANRAQAQFTAAIKAEYGAIVCFVSVVPEQRTAKLADTCIDDALHAGGVVIPPRRTP